MFDRLRKRSATDVANQLKASLVDVLQDQLLALIQYFPEHAVRDRSSAEPSQLHVLIVLDRLDLELLRKCANTIKAIPRHELIVPMVLSQAELIASTDVFPITFLEMKRNYDVLVGKDVLADLWISDVHLRLRCEQELKNLLIRMQSAFLLQNHRAEIMLESLRANYSTLLRCLRAAIQVLGESVPDSDQQVIALASSRFGLKGDALARIEEISSVESSIGAEAIGEVYGQLLIEVHRVATVVDGLELEEIVELDSIEG